jgi:hypothetical protein
MRAVFLVISTLFILQSSAQLGVGQWRDHLPYSETIDVCEGGERIYCATPYAVFSYDKLDNSVERYTKVNKLSDTGISGVAYHEELNILVVSYVNGNLDFIVEGSPINVPDIKRSDLVGNKFIHDIHLLGDKAYLACGFGVVVIDLIKFEVADTYFIGTDGSQIEVFDFESDDDFFYAMSEQGILTASRTETFLGNYQNWTLYEDVPEPGAAFVNLEMSDQIWVLHKDEGDEDEVYYKLDGGDWQILDEFLDALVRTIYMKDDRIFVSSFGILREYDLSLQIQSTLGEISGIDLRAQSVLIDKDEHLWLANEQGGLIGQLRWGEQVHVEPAGPRSANARKLDSYNNNLWIASGGVDNTWTSNYDALGIYGLVEEQWQDVPRFNNEVIPDYMTVSINPLKNDEVFLGSWVSGLVQVNSGQISEVYTQDNSSLNLGNFGGSERLGVGGVDFDINGNLWFTNNMTNTPLHVRTAGGDFVSYDFQPEINSDDLIGDVLATQQGFVWAILPRGGGLLVFDNNGSTSDTSDDNFKLLNNEEGNGGLPSSDIYSITEDLDEEIWVGTLQGIAVFYTPQSIFSGDNFDSQQILIEQDGNVQILLETETVTAIEIDGANRKWIGTQNSGVYLMSEDGTDQILHFTEDNSPLLSNFIFDISVNQDNGEVFFSTQNGIIGFRGDATNFDQEMEAVKVFPNPVRPDYAGVISIDGLARNADVKISDVSGNVVYQTTANGGRATWNGNDFNGQRVSTGVYLVFVTNDDGKATSVSKVAFVN